MSNFKMKYDIERQYLTGPSERRPCIPLGKCRFMVAHDTGNPGSTAAGNVGYYERSRNEMSASAHTFIDDERIIECIPFLTGPSEKAWHVLYNVTTDNQKFGDDANDVAGGVELCYGGNIDIREAYKRYIWYLAYACHVKGLDPAKDITGHFILDPARKVDPMNAFKLLGKTFDEFIQDVVDELNDCLREEVKVKMSVEDANKIIGLLGAVWNICTTQADKDEAHRLANELRKASGQKVDD